MKLPFKIGESFKVEILRKLKREFDRLDRRGKFIVLVALAGSALLLLEIIR